MSDTITEGFDDEHNKKLQNAIETLDQVMQSVSIHSHENLRLSMNIVFLF